MTSCKKVVVWKGERAKDSIYYEDYLDWARCGGFNINEPFELLRMRDSGYFEVKSKGIFQTITETHLLSGHLFEIRFLGKVDLNDFL